MSARAYYNEHDPKPPRPGTRRFVGPLTPAQQRMRIRARARFQEASEIADARNVPMRDALKIVSESARYVTHLRWEALND